jgi:hypothetical protein
MVGADQHLEEAFLDGCQVVLFASSRQPFQLFASWFQP